MVIPTALAVGEETNCSGKEFLAAVVIGYEVLTRIGMSVMSLEFNNKYRPSSFLVRMGHVPLLPGCLSLMSSR